MFFTNWIRQLGSYNINRSIQFSNEIITFVNNIQQDNENVVIVNLNHEVIYILLF